VNRKFLIVALGLALCLAVGFLMLGRPSRDSSKGDVVVRMSPVIQGSGVATPGWPGASLSAETPPVARTPLPSWVTPAQPLLPTPFPTLQPLIFATPALPALPVLVPVCPPVAGSSMPVCPPSILLPPGSTGVLPGLGPDSNFDITPPPSVLIVPHFIPDTGPQDDEELEEAAPTPAAAR
jgi:hypothetical protein